MSDLPDEMEMVLHERELDLMEVLWERGSGTAAEVRGALTDHLAYNTVLTILRRLEEKGFLRREEEGRAHRYYPLVQREQVRKIAVRRLVDGIFGGSPELLLTQLISERELTDRQLRRLAEVLREHLPEED